MKIVLSYPQNSTFDRHFPERLLNRIRQIGDLTLNMTARQFTRDEWKQILPDTDILLTHWGCTQFDEELLNYAPKLRLLGHCAGTVAHIASEEFYNRGIPVLSANEVMSKYVAEATVGNILVGLREMLPHDALMRRGEWKKDTVGMKSLFDTEVGIIGLGAVGRNLLDLLRVYGCPVYVYDPYLPDDGLDKWEFARKADFRTAMSRPVVSVHASQTPETYHMINAEALALMPDGGLLVNTSRGSLVDTEALIAELQSKRLRAVLDVYEHEGCKQDDRLLACTDNLLLQPHVAALPASWRMTEAIIDDIERFLRGEPTKLTVSWNQYLHMTQE